MNTIENNTKEKSKIIISLFFILLSVPFINITSIFNGAVLVGVIICFCLLIKNKYTMDKYILFSSIFFIVGEILSLFKCPDLSRSIIFTVQKFIVLFIIYPVMRSLIKNDEIKKEVSNKYMIGCLFSALIIIASAMLNLKVGFINYSFKTQRLVFAGFGPNVIARMLCIGALFSFYEAQISKGKIKLKKYIYYFVISLALLTTVSMSGILLLGTGSIIILLCANNNIKKFGIIKIVLTFGIIITIIVMMYNYIPNVKTQIDKFIQRFDDTSDDRTNGRLEGLNGFENNLSKYFFVGIGYGCSNYINGGTIHFPIIASILETGIFGFLGCCLLYLFPLIVDLNVLKRKFNIYSFVSLLIILGDMIQPNPNYVFTWFAIFLGCIAIDRREKFNAKEIN